MPTPAPSATTAPLPGEISRRLVTQDGASIAYRLRPALAGGSTAPRRAVVLLHGMASNLSRWTEFVSQTKLVQDWNLLRLDLRGHGDSLTRGRVDMAIWCNDLAEILAREAIGEVVLVGHCLGANLALHCARHLPAKVLGLVLIEPMLRQALTGQLAWAARLRPLLAALVPGLRALAALGWHRRNLAPLDLVALDHSARETLARSGKFPEARFASAREDLKSLPLVIYLQDLIAVTGPLPPLAALATPALILLAAGSGFGAIEPTRRALQALPQARIELVDALHWIPTERPEALREAIEAWCVSPEVCAAKPAQGDGGRVALTPGASQE